MKPAIDQLIKNETQAWAFLEWFRERGGKIEGQTEVIAKFGVVAVAQSIWNAILHEECGDNTVH